jgi:hypothetical protein
MRRRGRAVGLGASAAAFLSFGLTPLGTAPAAHADVDWLVDLFDPGAVAGVDPTGGADWDFAPPLAEGEAFQSFYIPLHDALESWIHSDLGQTIDGLINPSII